MPILSKTSNKFRIFTEYVRYRYKPFKSSDRSVFFLCSHSIPGRRLFQLVSHFLFSGYDCFLDYSFFQYFKLNSDARFTAQLQGVFSVKKNIKEKSIIISDNKELLDSFNSNALKVYVNYLLLENKFDNIKGVTKDDLFYPIGLHRFFLTPSVESKVFEQAHKPERKIGAIFAGNTASKTNPQKKSYNMHDTKKLLNINTRIEMFSYISMSLPEKYLYIPTDLKTFLSDIDSGFLRNKVVLLNTRVFSIPHDKYFYVLLNSNFYVHMCGFKQPFCHNQIESMLAGCIPVTQFAPFFFPGFKHELNSLLFNSLDELNVLLRDITSCKYDNRLDYMRSEIIKYYKEHHSLESFSKKLSYLVESGVRYTNHYIVK